jgi:hypothetical protein
MFMRFVNLEAKAKNTVNHFHAPADTPAVVEEVSQQEAFNRTYKLWIEEQNARFEEKGLWCDELRVW